MITQEQRAIIQDIHALLSTPKNWTRGCSARDAEATPISPLSPRAVCWCFMGAIRKTDPQSQSSSVSPNFNSVMSYLKAVAVQHMHDPFSEGIRRTVSLVTVNEFAYQILNASGQSVSGREAVLRVCELALEQAEREDNACRV